MSEIKGQLLGMVMVLLVFALVGGVIYTLFQDGVANLEGHMDTEFDFTKSASTSSASTQGLIKTLSYFD